MAEKIVIKNYQSPGDIVMLTAAVRDLHQHAPGRFLTDVRTSCPELWENNPHLTPIDDGDREARRLAAKYPLIQRCNTAPYHFVHGFIHHLGRRLGIPIEPTLIKGDIHLAEEERSWMSQVEEEVGADIPFWLIAAGGKWDYTIKWWERSRYQAVVDGLRDRVAFVQVGAADHHHPALQGVLDLRGKTDLRQAVRLVYHAAGVLCPVTMWMHLAAAVETREDRYPSRPCVVVAGGREPPQWEAYPGHQFLHTVGALPCCVTGGCWRSRTVPIGDGDVKDKERHLCLDVVDGRDGPLPKCLSMIEPESVIAAVCRYLDGGVAAPLDGAGSRAFNARVRQTDRMLKTES